MLVPSKDEYLSTSRSSRSCVPIYREVLADIETPLSAYWKIAREEPYSFLLESVTGGENLGRYSVLGARPEVVLRAHGNRFERISNGVSEELGEGADPLVVLRNEMERSLGCFSSPAAWHPGLPKFVGGAVGFLAYEYARFIESLPESLSDDLGHPDMVMMIARTVVVFDHAKNLIRIISLADGTPEGYERAADEIGRLAELLDKPLPALPAESSSSHETRPNMSPEAYQGAVRKAVQYVSAGDCIQVVLSQRFDRKLEAHPLSVYRALRRLNPSPYMFLLRCGDIDVVGASPEILVSLANRKARVRPIAGTRARGATPEEDSTLASELLADEKELAEHIMLVDLGRNDLGRVCEFGSITVNELMTIEKYSHVMHIVSDVTGELREGVDAFDLVRACFPAGTVSGAPKVRAMEIVAELEPSRRGVYAGAAGYFSATGDADLAISIRAIAIKDGVASVQAGAGIVYDSIPENEHQECLNKARACLRALEIADGGE